jgi:hypothetical protein
VIRGTGRPVGESTQASRDQLGRSDRVRTIRQSLSIHPLDHRVVRRDPGRQMGGPLGQDGVLSQIGGQRVALGERSVVGRPLTSRMGDSRCKTDSKQNPPWDFDDPVARAGGLPAFWLLSLAPRQGSPQLSAPVPLAERIAPDAIVGLVQTATQGNRQPSQAAHCMPRDHDFE